MWVALSFSGFLHLVHPVSPFLLPVVSLDLLPHSILLGAAQNLTRLVHAGYFLLNNCHQ